MQKEIPGFPKKMAVGEPKPVDLHLVIQEIASRLIEVEKKAEATRRKVYRDAPVSEEAAADLPPSPAPDPLALLANIPPGGHVPPDLMKVLTGGNSNGDSL